MLVSLSKTLVDCQQVCYSGSVRREESQDAVVPDTMPDVGAILSTTGCVLIRSKEVGEGRVRLEANVPARVLYRPEDGGPVRCLEIQIPFYVNLEDPQIPEGSVCRTTLRLTALETRLLNPRKVSVRAELLCSVVCYAPGQLSCCGAPAEAPEFLNLRERPVPISAVCAVTEKTFVLTDEFSIPETRGPATALLAQHTALQVEELRQSGSKLILRGSAESALSYLDENGQVGDVRFTTAFSQILELNSLPEETAADAEVLLSGAYYDLEEGTGLTGTMELHLVAQVRVWEKRTLSLLTDAYCNRYPLETEREPLALDSIARTLTLRETLRENFPTGQQAAETLQAWAEVGEARSDPEGLQVPVTVILYYLTGEGELCAARHSYTVPLRTPLEPGERLELLSAGVPELNLTPAPGGAELRLTLEARVMVLSTRTLEAVTALRYDETAPLDQSQRPSLTLLLADPAGDLWDLARENCSTPQAIRDANPAGDAAKEAVRWLLIPKIV